jgi:hypothetical protein
MWKRRSTDDLGISRQGWDVKAKQLSVPQFRVIRKWFSDTTTISELFIEGSKKCFILEDAVRAEKIPGKTAIPEGTYELIISFSNKFKKHLPLLLNVPNYSGIRIHPGNDHNDTSGCLLPGMEKDDNNEKIFYSRKAFSDIFELLKVMCAHEKVWIEITNERKETV